uniref:Gamma-soluble NSF attachment protein n=1 Tax=Pseudo-nitzschia australis TaxID=44445 RepID=A0A7S4EJ94_9STRA|mmetsp:Transcript_22667/g.49316  ORF Transcript_22667/g.49316 Transcript_22667/m.49316 type:complete len:518 (-) Transcript_22667:109-1662(-)
MSYKQNASANRDALFGGAGGSSGGGKKKKSSSRSKTTTKPSSKPSPKSSSTASKSPSAAAAPSTSKGYKYSKKSKKPTVSVGLSGDAKKAKLKEADDYRDKAKKAMQRGIFSRPDPLVASTYYKKAADGYQQCNEFRLERLYRISSADCQLKCGAYATAAAEYTRAAELVEVADDETTEMKREIGRKCLLDAADAWLNMNEPGKAASSKVDAALALTWGDDSNVLPKLALQALEEAVEAHVPDPLNPYARYRQTGVSAYINPDSEETVENPTAETLEFAQQHIVTRPYAHESIQEVVYLLISFGEYPSASYAQGAVSTVLSRDGVSSLTLGRSFVAETILTLAMGDPIAAEQQFLNRHVQKTSYLSSRECKLGEELFRAVKIRDDDALEEARSTTMSNRAAVGNLHESLREVLGMIRLSGVARKKVDDSSGSSNSKKTRKKTSEAKTKKSSASASASAAKKETNSLEELSQMKTGYEKDPGEDDAIDAKGLQDELDALDFGDDSDESDLDDDEFDLR